MSWYGVAMGCVLSQQQVVRYAASCRAGQHAVTIRANLRLTPHSHLLTTHPPGKKKKTCNSMEDFRKYHLYRLLSAIVTN